MTGHETRSTDGASSRPVRVQHILTRMNLGGAQETVLLLCALSDRQKFAPAIWSSPEYDPGGGHLHAECRAAGVPLRFLRHLTRPIRPYRDLLALRELTQLLRREKPPIVHTHTPKAGSIGRIAARLARVPILVHTVHGWALGPDQGRVTRAVYLALERKCAPWCDKMICVTAADREQGLQLGIGRAEQYVVIRSGIELDAFRPTISRAEARERLGLSSAGFVVGSVGRLSAEKAPVDMVRAFTVVARARPDAHLVITGDGPLRPEVEAAVQSAGLTGRVHLLGTRRDVPQVMAALDALALTSHREGLPRVLPQAMAVGLPMVATRVGGIPEVVREGENGFLVEAGDMDAMGARLLELAANLEHARAMGVQGQARVEEFSATTMARAQDALYDELLSHNGKF